MEAPLIYDVGLCNGDDSAYYLHLGFRVVAIEANPNLAEAAEQRFASEIASGQLNVVNVGISAERGRAPFWICDDHLEWSSFHRAIASRGDSVHHAIEIPTVPFDAILEEHGMPLYCKIDIEGNDHLCLAKMRKGHTPPFLSLELSRLSSGNSFVTLCELGYKRFKVIDQARFCTVAPRVYRLLDAPSVIGAVARRANRLGRSRMSHDGWRFPMGSSGAIGPATPGRWLDIDSARRICDLVEERKRNTSLLEWFDLHAALEEPGWAEPLVVGSISWR